MDHEAENGIMTASELKPLLGFALWNTRLGPPSLNGRVTEDHLQLTRHVIADIVVANGTQLLALTEVRRIDVISLLPEPIRSKWETVRDTSGETHDFDVALLVDRTSIALEQHEFVTQYHEGSRVRCGLICILRLRDDSLIVTVVAHWKSDLGGHEQGQARRVSAAAALNNAIGKTLRDIGGPAHVLVLGDFNAEPYDAAFHALPTSRERRAVLRHRPKTQDDLLLYNPSWRWLGETEPWIGEELRSIAGTYNSGKHDAYAWRTFDQLLVSSSLLTTRGWFLREDLTGICCSPALVDSATGPITKPIDHLPIVGKLDYKSE